MYVYVCIFSIVVVADILAMESGVPRRRKMEGASSAASVKRRKLASDNDEEEVVSHFCGGLSSPAESETSGLVPVFRCSSNELSELVNGEFRSVDSKVESLAEGLETEISTLVNSPFSEETIPAGEHSAETVELESSTVTKASPARATRKNPVGEMPSMVEIQEFFSAAEKSEQKRFTEKYNYDVVKDVPLEGRYQWVRLRP
ncbi:cyclin-dependent kinase inhibitor 7 [Diospyros lotus]|uniref:cyclin-dependent kinase inhibitor 7 n=1 Tax=Diospyros lotus TaxID=55363 RepID=UPI00224CC8E8|nr:cyclin-dependent kinase inhibitor 7 [Diospyros lotus]